MDGLKDINNKLFNKLPSIKELESKNEKVFIEKSEFKTKLFNPHLKKKRNKLFKDQYKKLEEIYLKNKKPSLQVRKQLAKDLNLLPRAVQIWFQNRRAKDNTRSSSSTPNLSPKNSPKLGRDSFWDVVL